MLFIGVTLALLLGGFGFFIFFRVSRFCFSHSSYDVFSPAIVKDRQVFTKWVFKFELGCS
jgi:hypothetical protein